MASEQMQKQDSLAGTNELSPALDSDSDVFTPLYDLSDKKKEEIADIQKQRLAASTKFMNTLYPQMLDNFRKYRSIAEPLVDDLNREITDEPNLFIPYPFGIVESELPRLAGKLPRIRVSARNTGGKEITEEEIKRRQNYLYYVFDRMKFLQTQTLWHRQFAIYGFSPLYYFWRLEESPVLVNDGKRIIKKITKKWDDFWCKVIDVFDSFMQPGVPAPEAGDWFIFRELVSKQDLKRLVESEIFYPEVEKALSDGKLFSENSDSGRQERDALIGNARDTMDQTWGKYELFWCLEDQRVTCMLGNEALAMVSDNPHPLQRKSVINLNLTELVSEPIGISTIEGLAGLPDKLNALTNARLKNMSLLLGKVFLVDANAQVDWDNFVMSAGNLIPVAGGDLEKIIKEIEFTDNTLSTEREILTSKEEMQFASGTSDYIVGVKSGARMADTATGVSTIVQEANARYGLKQAAYESDALRELIIAADAYGKLYMTDEKSIYVLGPEGFKSEVITPEDVAWEADLIVEPGSVVPTDHLSNREQLVNLLGYVVKMPGIVRVDKFMEQVLEAHDFRNVDELIIPQSQSQKSMLKDIQLAQAENISLGMGQQVQLSGNDQVHLAVHRQIDGSTFSPETIAVVREHIDMHEQHMEAAMQMQMMQMQQQQQGGMNAQPNQPNNRPQGPAQAGPAAGPRPVPQAPTAVPSGGMGGLPGISGGAGAGGGINT